MVSAQFKRFFWILLYAAPVLTFCYWGLFNHLPAGFAQGLPVAIDDSLTLKTQILAFTASLIPLAVVMYGIKNLIALFSLYENAVVFTQENVIYFRRLGYSLIYWVLACFVFTILISLVLTFNDPVGERMLVVQFGFPDFSLLLIAGVVILISWVMQEAVKLEYEQALTV